jgi:hypothetical protein
MLTLKKILTKKGPSGRVFKMIDLMVINNIYMNSYNAMNELALFENINVGAGLRRRYPRGE